MIILRIFFMGVIGAFIGWLTNKIALLSLFRPYEEKRILGVLKFQGLLPKNQNRIAQDIGKAVSEELVNVEDIVDEIFKKNKKRENRLFNNSFDTFTSDFESQFPFFGKLSPRKNMIKLVKFLTSKIDISSIVEDKLNKLSMSDLEELVNKIVKKEMRHIELLGGVLGLIIGLVQGLITLVI